MRKRERNWMLTSLHSAATYMSAGRSIPDILARLADSALELLQAEQVAVGVWNEGAERPLPVLVNLEPEQGERLLRLARDSIDAAPASAAPFTLRSNAPEHEPRFD